MKILLSVDHLEHSHRAIMEVAKNPWAKGTHIHVVTADGTGDPAAQKHNQELINKTVALLKTEHPSLSVEGQVLTGSPKSQVLNLATQLKPNLIVCGSRGRKGLTRMVLGSVSHAILLGAPCSVRIVRGTQAESSNVLLALDDSPFSTTAIEAVAQRPWTENTHFTCMTVVRPLADMVEGIDFYNISRMELKRNQAIQTATETLQHAVARINRAQKRVCASFEMVDGDPRETLVKEASNRKIDLIVLGCQGKDFIERVMVGSVSEAVATWAECSVEVVKPD